MRRIPSRSACHFVSSAGHRRKSNSVSEMFACAPSVFEAGAWLKRRLGNFAVCSQAGNPEIPQGRNSFASRFSGDMVRAATRFHSISEEEKL